MNIDGKFCRASKSDYRDGIVLVGLIGNVYPHDLKPVQIDHIKAFYNMPASSKHTIYNDWPEGIEASYAAIRGYNYNGFLLIEEA